MTTSTRGFTLLELMIAIAVASTLIAIAVPSFRSLIISNRLSVTSNEFVYAISEARSQGLRRNAPTLFCGSSGNPTAGDFATLSAACAGAGSVVARVVAADGTVSADVVRVAPSASQGVSVSNVQPLLFSGNGFGRVSGASAPFNGRLADIGTDQISAKNRRCIYLIAGSGLATCTITSDSTCPSNEPQNCL